MIRNLMIKRDIVRNYIKNNPGCTTLDIKKNTKQKIERIYKNMIDAYNDANVPLSKNLTKRSVESQKRDVINFIRKNPRCSVSDVHDNVGVNVFRRFGSIVKAYEEAGLRYPLRDFSSGVINPEVGKRCHQFENRVIEALSQLGIVCPKVKTLEGIADAVFVYVDKPFVVEIKDFRARNNITMSQLRQLETYMRELGIYDGLLICPKEKFPKRKNGRNVYKDGLNVFILSPEDLRGRRIKGIMSVQPG